MSFTKFIIERDESWKVFQDSIWDGTKVFIVDGDYVRDNISVDFVEGGHDLVYKFVPEGEIWVEKMIVGHDERMNMIHEIYEHTLMKHMKLSYDVAHDHTQTVEKILREHFKTKG
jgi:hypothetical protein